jgi:hypothetical protein
VCWAAGSLQKGEGVLSDVQRSMGASEFLRIQLRAAANSLAIEFRRHRFDYGTDVQLCTLDGNIVRGQKQEKKSSGQIRMPRAGLAAYRCGRAGGSFPSH